MRNIYKISENITKLFIIIKFFNLPVCSQCPALLAHT